MKFTLIILSLSVLLLGACRHGEHNELKEPDSSMINKDHPAKMTFESNTYDAGKVAWNEEIVHEFTFVNDGESPLNIVDVHTTCSCTVPEWPREAIKPGESSSILVKVKPKDKGKFKKTVTLSANTYPKTVTKLHVTGEVK